MTEDKPQKNPLGPTGQRVRENVRQLRDRLSYRELSERLEQLGRPIPTLGLSRIENGARRVDADDLVALALALGVNPDRLLLPADAPDDQDVGLTPAVKARPFQAWAWARGQQQLLAAEVALGRGDRPFREGQAEFLRKSLPPSERLRESHTAVKAAQDVLARVQGLLEWQGERDQAAALRPGEDPDPNGVVARFAGDLRRALARLNAEVDDLVEGADGER